MSVASNLGGGRHGHLTLTMMNEEYIEQTGFAFVTPHNPGNHPQSMGSAQEQVLVTEKFRQNQAMFRKYTAVDGALKNQLITAVESVLLSPMVDKLTGFGQVSHLPCCRIYFPATGKSKKSTLRKTQSRLWGPTTLLNPFPD